MSLQCFLHTSRGQCAVLIPCNPLQVCQPETSSSSRKNKKIQQNFFSFHPSVFFFRPRAESCRTPAFSFSFFREFMGIKQELDYSEFFNRITARYNTGTVCIALCNSPVLSSTAADEPPGC